MVCVNCMSNQLTGFLLQFKKEIIIYNCTFFFELCLFCKINTLSLNDCRKILIILLFLLVSWVQKNKEKIYFSLSPLYNFFLLNWVFFSKKLQTLYGFIPENTLNSI